MNRVCSAWFTRYVGDTTNDVVEDVKQLRRALETSAEQLRPMEWHKTCSLGEGCRDIPSGRRI